MNTNHIRFLVGAMVLLQSACGSSGPGTVSLLLTDAPGDFRKAVVTIDQIYLQGEGRVVLRDTPVTTDLITLANDTSELLHDVEVPEGQYSQLRFVISGGYIEVDDGDGTTSIYASSESYAGLPSGTQVDGTLQMPSYGTSGLKVDIGTLEVAGSQHVLLVDFDVAQSFGHDTGTTKWVMHPVVKGAELTLTTSVEVKLTRAPALTLPVGVTLLDFRATLTNSGGSAEELTFTDADGDGTAEAHFRYLMPGTYELELLGPGTPRTDPVNPVSLTLGSGEARVHVWSLIGL